MKTSSNQEINFLQILKPNEDGEDYVVGDIHGHFDKLDAKLEEIGFDYDNDRLIVVGDLIDRGPKSEKFMEYLEKDWFYTVRGNHEDFLVNCLGYMLNEIPMEEYVFNITWNTWMGNGGRWFERIFDDTPDEDKPALIRSYYDKVAALPFFMEIPYRDKKVGIVHAELRELDSWNDINTIADGGNIPEHTDLGIILRDALWSRTRFERYANTLGYTDQHDSEIIQDVDAIFCGHTPIVDYENEAPLTIGNNHYIDTYVYGTFENNFQLIKLSEFFA